jgi:hypothetical protein
MKHLSEEELVEHHYAPQSTKMQRHIESCAGCGAAYTALESDLGAILPVEPPQRDASYGEQVWNRLADRLPSQPEKMQRRVPRMLWLGFGYAAVASLLVISAFYAGRFWEHRQQPRQAAAVVQSRPQQHVVVVILGDHLDRSERLLVELKHVDADNTELVSPLRDQARALLAANRICRQNAEKDGDPALTKTLGHLDHLLTQLANQPGGLNADAITRLQTEMNSQDLLFEVRVLRSRIPHRQPSGHSAISGGTA